MMDTVSLDSKQFLLLEMHLFISKCKIKQEKRQKYERIHQCLLYLSSFLNIQPFTLEVLKDKMLQLVNFCLRFIEEGIDHVRNQKLYQKKTILSGIKLEVHKQINCKALPKFQFLIYGNKKDSSILQEMRLHTYSNIYKHF